MRPIFPPLSKELLDKIRAAVIDSDIVTKVIKIMGDQKLVEYP